MGHECRDPKGGRDFRGPWWVRLQEPHLQEPSPSGCGGEGLFHWPEPAVAVGHPLQGNGLEQR